MDTICAKTQCSACKACINKCPRQCITMVADSLDVPYPKIDKEKCIDCSLCQKACPNNNDLLFHEARQILAAWSLDTITRKRSASGGVAAELYRYAIENGWYTCGVTINHHKATFVEIKNIEDIEKVRNSKYVYSDTLDIYQQIHERLKDGRNVLFIGLPCQVAGLYCFLDKPYSNLVTVDLVCHGVVPDEYLKQHIEHIEDLKNRKVSQVYFRNPELHTYTYNFTLGDCDGLFYKKQVYEDDVYQLGYHKALIYRENCYHCQYARQQRIGDLTICDFSAIGEVVPVSYDRMNVSCILVNTDCGEKIISHLSNRLFIEQRPRIEVFDYEPQLHHPYRKHPSRETFTSEYILTHDFAHAAAKALQKELEEYKSARQTIFNKIAKKVKHNTHTQQLKYFLSRLIRHPSTPFGAILMLHKVDKPDAGGIWYNQHLKLSPDTLEEMVNYARSFKCRFVSLDEMAEALASKRPPRRLIAITLDDGYRDNYTLGGPIFTRLKIPFAIYVCTKMVKGEMLYWWEILEQLVLSHDSIVLSDGRTYDSSTKYEKEQAFLAIRELIIQQPQDRLEESMKQLLTKYDIDYRYGNDSLGLTWAQIRELNHSPLATIGNHTYSHKAFTGCTDETISADISRANSEMLNNAGKGMQHFAFPFGEALAVSQHDIELVKHLGFKTSATTKEDLIRYSTKPLDLPRLFVTERNWKQVIDRIIECC